MNNTMKRNYLKPICEQIVLLTENSLLQNSFKMNGESYGQSTEDTEWEQ